MTYKPHGVTLHALHLPADYSDARLPLGDSQTVFKYET